MDDLYREYILDHFKNPRNYGHLILPDVVYSDTNPLCGDEITVELKIKDGIIDDVRFTGKGCAISQAAASILTELVKGFSLDEIKLFGKDELLEELDIPISAMRLKCALLPLKAVKAGAYGFKGWP